MKKLSIIMIALMAVVMFTAPSFAKNTVQMTLTSPTIYKEGCEKIGSTTYSFQEASVINVGDWWYMDLPENVTICKNYNYVIAGRDIANPTVTLVTGSLPSIYQNVTFAGGGIAVGDTIEAGDTIVGPLSVTGTNGVDRAVGNMAFLVKGTSGSRRITIYALTPGGTASTLTVDDETQLHFNLFDGQEHEVETADPDSSVILLPGTGANALVYSTPITAGTFPAVENTLCANAENYTSQYVYTSYASKDDNITFSGDAQIAHTGASDITLESCAKDATIPTVEIVGDQGVCEIDYESTSGVTGVRDDFYCDAVYWNRFII